MPDLTFRKEFPIHSYELDFEGLARPVALLNFLQDAAGDHAAHLGWSVTDLLKKNMTWVLSRTHLRVERYPAWGESLTVLTWPSGRKGYFALRDFEVSDGEGNTIATATTSWMVLDLGRKQPLKVDDILPDNFLLEKRALADDFGSLPVLDRPDHELSFRVDSGHLDLNRHVNNAIYVQWALEAVPAAAAGRLRPVGIEVSYRAEAFYGDLVLSRAKVAPEAAVPESGTPASLIVLHQIVNASTGAELSRLRTRWK
ncbi:MAG TPA: acyl-ACP thioesterase domain-containing protein [Burkholderiales bacterium]|nr:acyl-ACP thioesterase domain-containing protein [Burkholderiales bacterium]